MWVLGTESRSSGKAEMFLMDDLSLQSINIAKFYIEEMDQLSVPSIVYRCASQCLPQY